MLIKEAFERQFKLSEFEYPVFMDIQDFSRKSKFKNGGINTNHTINYNKMLLNAKKTARGKCGV